jgi:hypothetical protein
LGLKGALGSTALEDLTMKMKLAGLIVCTLLLGVSPASAMTY